MFLFILCAMLIGAIAYYLQEITQNKTDALPSLYNEGYTAWEHRVDMDGMNPLEKMASIRDDTLVHFPDGYEFLDYYYYIKGCSLSFFHRDVTNGQKYFNTKFPTYTVILYEYDGDFLSICPFSHTHFPFTWSLPVGISGRKNTVIVFNSDMLHSGMMNTVGAGRAVLQFKIAHKDDMVAMEHLRGIHVEKVVDSNGPMNYYVEICLRKMSYLTSFITNTATAGLLQKRFSDGFFSLIQGVLPVEFYNNPINAAKNEQYI